MAPTCIENPEEIATPWKGKEMQPEISDKLASNEGFEMPENNAFGNSFRDYEADNGRNDIVEQHYKSSHINQTVDFVKRMRAEYRKLDKAEMGIWECCELLNEVVDDSDPDLDEPQIQHLLQSAEAIRKDYPNEDWLHLTALIHDLGKILVLPQFGELPQWAVVGDTFPVGCAFDESNVHFKYFKENPDFNNPKYNTKNGIYSEGCGLDNVLMSWGHDDYMCMVAKENGTTLPSAALFIVRYHSFYPLHKHGAYAQFMNKEDKENMKWLKIFKDYEAEGGRKDIVEQLYKLSHINQTVDFVKRMRAEYEKLDKAKMGIWECCELLNEVVDDSDPDLDEPQIQHLLQSAEAIRKDYSNEDWLHLTALIHDLGKILVLPQFGELPQWAVTGDTFPVGCAFDESNVHFKYFKENPDFNNPKYNTKNGIYSEGCGLDNILMSWGHDDYMCMVAKANGTTLPSAALFIIRYHSFYPLHTDGAYAQFMNEEDKENMKWLEVFNKYDLYSKSNVLIDVEKVKPYYESLIAKTQIAYNGTTTKMNSASVATRAKQGY
ncbi:Inositol oxygenase [Corchorus capsularis]|uniref:inositol oxygenase n=1 Tax=Corchorus capsularis TaxID=210143 RepID=A0A1R3KH78_COCAP|nr:Inositol oxygenase [Corchorus capsularis]